MKKVFLIFMAALLLGATVGCLCQEKEEEIETWNGLILRVDELERGEHCEFYTNEYSQLWKNLDLNGVTDDEDILYWDSRNFIIIHDEYRGKDYRVLPAWTYAWGYGYWYHGIFNGEVTK